MRFAASLSGRLTCVKLQADAPTATKQLGFNANDIDGLRANGAAVLLRWQVNARRSVLGTHRYGEVP